MIGFGIVQKRILRDGLFYSISIYIIDGVVTLKREDTKMQSKSGLLFLRVLHILQAFVFLKLTA